MKRCLALICVLCFSATGLWAHCQIPCGIYGDETRFQLLDEHVRTLEKSMVQIRELSDKAREVNQVTRWVLNKEAHADKIVDIVTNYFLAQRIKPLPKGRVHRKDRVRYRESLRILHEILVHTMKARQTTDGTHCHALRKLIARFRILYFGKASK